jgi:hypothetical protein
MWVSEISAKSAQRVGNRAFSVLSLHPYPFNKGTSEGVSGVESRVKTARSSLTSYFSNKHRGQLVPVI